jgi:hypothetical protein
VLTGTYNYQDGKVTGTVTGNTATGTWSESPSFKPPLDAGDFTFTLSSDCKSFTGQWRYGSCDWDGDINGKRAVQPSPNPNPNPNPNPIPQNGWAGAWDTAYGKMTLTVNGNQVTGNYEHSNGRITGTISGNSLSAWRAEQPTYQPPDEAGLMELTLSADGQSFTGRWKYGSSGGSWTDNWNGKRTATAKVPGSSCDWTGTWSFDWANDLKLTQSGSSVTGTYTRGSKTCYVNGTVSDKTLTGTWNEGSDQGKLQWILSSDCNTFTGQYTHTLDPGSGWYYLHDKGIRLTQPGPQPTPNPPGPLPDFNPAGNWDWNGPWDTDWGRMQLSQSGTNVSGTYTLDSGKVQATSPGMMLYGTWSKAPTYAEPKDAGALVFSMAPFADAFVGRWRYGSCPWEGSWNGKLKGSDINPTPNPNPNPIPNPVPGNHNPTASFSITPQSPRVGDTVVATGQASDPDGDALSYAWYFDGAQQSQYTNQKYMVQPNAPAGTHTISLQVSDAKGGTAAFQSQVTVSQAPAPQPTPGTNHPPVGYFYITPQSPTNYDTIVATSQASDQDGDLLSYSWFKDGAQAMEYNNQTYMVWANPPLGAHTISLQISDGKGGITPAQQQVNVTQGTAPQPLPPNPGPIPNPTPNPTPTPGGNNAPKAYFTINPPQPQAGNDIQVVSQCTDADNDKLSYSWSVDEQPASQYAGQSSWKWSKPASGGHVVQLSVNDGRGGSDSFSRRVKIPAGTTPADSGKKKFRIGPFSCFIATAAYGSETAKELDLLRAFRDKVLMKSEPGKLFVDTYYKLSPPFAEFIADHEDVRTLVRERLLDPIVGLLKQTESSWDR